MVSNWEEKTLEDIISKEKYSIKRGPFGSSLRKEFFVENGIRVFEQYNPINNDPNWCRYRITKEKYEELKAFTCKAGDFLISCSGTMGKIVFLPEGTEKGIINQALLKIRLDNDIVDNNFFMYLFQSPYFQNKIFSSSKGSAIQNISSVKDLKKITFLLPTLKEQKIIVEKLDDAFQKIETLENNTKENIKNIEDLYNSYLNKIFTDNTGGWEEKKLEDLVNFYRGLTYKKTDEVEYSSNIVLRANNIDLETNQLNFDELKYLREDFYIDDSKKVKKNSIIICTASGSKSHLGKVALIDNEYNYAFGGFMGMLIPKNNIYSKYLFYSLITERYKDYIDNIANGTNINNLKFSDISSFFIPLPPFEEQKKIVDKLDIFNNKIQIIKQNYQNKLTLLDNLKKSILNKAFKGEV